MQSPRRIPVSILLFSALAAAILSAAALSPAAGTGAEGPTSFTGTSAGAIVGSTNKGSGAAVQAVTGTVSGGQALVGVGTSTTNSSLGVKGQVYGPTSTGVYGNAVNSDTSHPSNGVVGASASGNGVFAKTTTDAAAALFARNFGSTTGMAIQAKAPGNGIVATSTNANGVVGQASATPSPAPPAYFALAGVLGRDLTTSPIYFYDAGVGGTSTYGRGVFGRAPFGVGVEGDSSSGRYCNSCGTGVLGRSDSGYGVWGMSTGFIGVEGDSTNDYAVVGKSTNSVGVAAVNYATPLPNATSLPNGANISTAALAVYGLGGAPLIIARGNGGTDVMSLDNSGNLILSGTSSGSGTPLVVHRTTLGRGVITYSGHQSLPSIEDFGEARLVNGQAYVRLDPTFAGTIDPRADYLVFLTPEGDNRGLYVTQKTPRGFTVRESQGGRSTLSFDYRIVAKPYDTNSPRLPLISTLPHPRQVPLPLIRRLPQFQMVPPLR